MSPHSPARLKNLRMPSELPAGGPDISSVLVVVAWNRTTSRLEIVLTKRTDLVETHKGQVSFPGGFWERGDENLLKTALREAEEEIGIQAPHVEICGGLEEVRTRGNVRIFPWVGMMELPYEFRVNASEVAGLLFLPVDKLVSEGLKAVEIDLGGRKIQSQGLWVDGELVWGATARMLHQLINCL